MLPRDTPTASDALRGRVSTGTGGRRRSPPARDISQSVPGTVNGKWSHRDQLAVTGSRRGGQDGVGQGSLPFVRPGQRVIRPEPSSHQLGGPGQRPALVFTQPQKRPGQPPGRASGPQTALYRAPPGPFEASAALPPAASAWRAVRRPPRHPGSAGPSRSLTPPRSTQRRQTAPAYAGSAPAAVSPPPSGYRMVLR